MPEKVIHYGEELLDLTHDLRFACSNTETVEIIEEMEVTQRMLNRWKDELKALMEV